MGRPALYPWSHWFAELEDGKTLTLQRGQDFTTPSTTMRGAFHNEAKRRFLPIETERVDGGATLVVRMRKRFKYPWDKWLDGQQWVLTWNQDFLVTAEDMRTMCRRAARARGLRLDSSIRGDMLMIKAHAGPIDSRDIHDRVAARQAAQLDEEGQAYEAYLEMTDTNALQSGTVRSDSES